MVRFAASLALIASLVVGCGVGGNTLTGTFTLRDSDLTASCVGSGGYSDIRSGVDVVVRDGGGAIIASSRLESGQYRSGSCIYPFTVTNVPSVPFYAIEVGRRGSLTYARTDLESRGWRVAFELGN